MRIHVRFTNSLFVDNFSAGFSYVPWPSLRGCTRHLRILFSHYRAYKGGIKGV